jgi:23S rRNA (adenine2503-C2)-methyltransferase
MQSSTRRENSEDGTIKLTFPEGYSAVIIPHKDDKIAVCVSCQIGCPVGCTFCYTAKIGFKRNLTAEEILVQIEEARKIKPKINSIIFMGMGEPMTNFSEVSKAIEFIHEKYSISYKKITLSTMGINLEKLKDVKYRIAISLHSPFDEERKALIPAARFIQEIVDYSQSITDKDGVMIAYTLIKDVNDTDRHLEKLLSLDWNKNTYFNLIEFNDINDLKRSERIMLWRKAIMDKGFKCFTRQSRGADIGAACGMLDF